MRRLAIFIVSTFMFATASFAKVTVADIAQAFNTANAEMISTYFDSNVDLKILENENIYSRQQARILLLNFVNDKKPNGFVLKHEGGPENSRFAIGELSAKDGVYRVYYLLKEKNGATYIYKLRIEPNE